jgi:hypothetical protein
MEKIKPTSKKQTKLSLQTYLKTISSVDESFIDLFYKFYDEDKVDQKYITLDDVMNWLGIDQEKARNKYILKFKEKFIPNIHYDETINNTKVGNPKHTYKINYALFVDLCQRSRAINGEKVRQLLRDCQEAIHTYYEDFYKIQVDNSAFVNVQGPVIYILSVEEDSGLYKIGKSKNLKKRLKTYKTGHVQDPEILYTIKVTDSSFVENCVKLLLLKHKKVGEVYRCDLELIKKAINDCATLGCKYDLKELDKIKDIPKKSKMLMFVDDGKD